MEMVEQKEYREELLKWCNDIYVNWENLKSRFSIPLDEKSINEWEESCRNLMGKLSTDIEVELEDYHEATRLYEQWEKLNAECYVNQENIELEERKIETMSMDSNIEMAELSIDNERIAELTERIELIKMAFNTEVPMQEIRGFLLSHN